MPRTVRCCARQRAGGKQMKQRIERPHARRLSLMPLALIAILVLVSMALIACDPGERVTIENRTDQTVAVFDNGNQRNLIAPGDTARYAILIFERGTMTFTVKNLAGKVLASQTFTWEEITEADGITIVVQ